MKNAKIARVNRTTFISLIVFVCVLAVLTIIFCILYAVNKTSYQSAAINLENIYQRSFYDLVDDVNNTEVNLSKLLASTDKQYSKKLLNEIIENTNSAQNNISYLPISVNGIPETTSFINQLNGYAVSISDGETVQLSDEELQTLKELYRWVAEIKYQLTLISNDIVNGYNISVNSKDNKADFTNFTTKFQQVKSIDMKYPTMIYDGPFSDSILNKEIKGLNFAETSKEDAQLKAEEIFEGSKVSFETETKGRFETYDFSISKPNGVKLYAQLTKKGSKVLTISSFLDKSTINYTKDEAISIAEKFAEKLGLENMKCIWSDVLENNVYLNLAPVENDIIYYPDLIKVKIDLSTGEILGWEATAYYTNHTSRNIPPASFGLTNAQNKIDQTYLIEKERLALTPLDYNREVLCYEFECYKGGITYFVYINAETGKEENILRVIETENGSLLM